MQDHSAITIREPFLSVYFFNSTMFNFRIRPVRYR